MVRVVLLRYATMHACVVHEGPSIREAIHQAQNVQSMLARDDEDYELIVYMPSNNTILAEARGLTVGVCNA